MQAGTFADVAERANRQEVLADLYRESGGTLDPRTHRGACILHGGERDSFAALSYGFRCHACGAHGDVVHFVRLRLFPNLPVREGRVEALRWLAPRVGVDLGAAPPPAWSKPEPQGMSAARALVFLHEEGAVTAEPADIFAGAAEVYPEVRSAEEWAGLRRLLLESWLPCELERAGLWKRGQLALPAEHPARLRIRRDEQGIPTGMYFLKLTGEEAAA